MKASLDLFYGQILIGEEVYEVTSKLLAGCAARLLGSAAAPAGVVSPGRAFDPDDLLQAIGLTYGVTDVRASPESS